MQNKPNLQTNIYTGYIEEVIYEDNKPTLMARIRVPSVHGYAGRGLESNQLPIAVPLVVPGMSISPDLILQHLESTRKVMVMFESGNTSSVVYFGLKATPSVAALSVHGTTILRYDNLLINPPEDIRQGIIYWDNTTNMLYYVNDPLSPTPFISFFDGTGLAGDTLVGVLTVLTDKDLSTTPAKNENTLDDYTCKNNEFALSLNSYSSRGIYRWDEALTEWVRTSTPELKYVYHITNGTVSGDRMVKITGTSPYYAVVKESSLSKWMT